MDRTFQVLALVALLLYIAPAAFAGRLSDGQRGGMQKAALGAVGIGLAIALIETILWFVH
jgi:hypothetical protein